jgi:hypothetical protein
MKQEIFEAAYSLWKLGRFVFWYAAGLAALFWVLPLGAKLLQARYETMDASIKFVVVVGFFSLVAAWQYLARRERR